MEYEIDDDPQGLPDQPDGDRDGGVRDRPILFYRAVEARRSYADEDRVEDRPMMQMGELA